MAACSSETIYFAVTVRVARVADRVPGNATVANHPCLQRRTGRVY